MGAFWRAFRLFAMKKIATANTSAKKSTAHKATINGTFEEFGGLSWGVDVAPSALDEETVDIDELNLLCNDVDDDEVTSFADETGPADKLVGDGLGLSN